MLKTTRLLTFLGIFLSALLCMDSGVVYAASIAKPKTIKHKDLPAFVPDQVVVAFKPGTPSEEKRSTHAQTGGRVISTIAAINVDVVSIPKGKVFEKTAAYERNSNVEYAEPNYYYTLHMPPNEGVSSDIFCDDYSFQSIEVQSQPPGKHCGRRYHHLVCGWRWIIDTSLPVHCVRRSNLYAADHLVCLALAA